MAAEDWSDLCRKLDWEFSYVAERDVYPEVQSGRPWLPASEWAGWDEPFRTTYGGYVAQQHDNEESVRAVRDAVGQLEDARKLPAGWLNGLKLHAATLPLAEFAAVVGNLRAARFGRDSAWRSAALFGALDEMRHTQIPLLLIHDLGRWDPQFDWTHRFFHTNNWVAIAAAPVRRAAAGLGRRRVRHRHQLRVRDRLHEPAVRGAVLAGARRGRQPARRLAETMLITYDWAEAFTALNLCAKPALDALFWQRLGEPALAEDAAWHRDWAAALAALALESNPANRETLVGWVDRWNAPAREAVLALGGLAGPAGQDAARAAVAQAQAWQRRIGVER